MLRHTTFGIFCAFALACTGAPPRRAAPPPYRPPGAPTGYSGAYPSIGPGAGVPPRPPPPSRSPAPAPRPNSKAPPAPPAPTPPPATVPAAAADPIVQLDVSWMRGRAQAVMIALRDALPPTSRQRVVEIPLVVDATPGEVNAFAACDGNRAFMAITDALLEIAAWLSMTAASDERFGGDRTAIYVRLIADGRREGRPLPRPAPGFLPASVPGDVSRVARQYALFDEQLAFVLGHELAHHYLGHLPCTGKSGPLGAADVARLLSFKVPLLNQPNESAADIAGINNLLTVGRGGPRAWTEGGALLMLRFFDGISGLRGADLIFAFQRSHPLPAIRIPIVQQSARAFRATGGVGIPVPRLGG